MATSRSRYRRGIGIVATGLVLSVVTACGGGGSASPEEPLQFFLSGDANQGGGIAAMAAEYEKQTGVKVEVVDIANADLQPKLKNAAQANDLPALARVGSLDPVWQDATVDLKPILDGSKIRRDLAAIDEDGKVLSLPTDITAVGLYVNKSLFDKAGVTYPTSADDIWSWDEFVAKVKEVQQKTGTTYGMVMDRSSHRLKSLLYEFGSEYWQPDASGTFRTNPNTKVALEYFKALNDDSFMPRSVWLTKADPNALFKSGDVVAYYSGSWQIADFAKNITDFEWASVRLPKQPVRATQYGNAASSVVFEGTGQEEAAVAFLKWMYQPENYRTLAARSGMLPAIEGLEVTYPEHADAFAIYNEEIAASAPIVSKIKQQELAYEAAGKAIVGPDPLRDETVKYLNGEQDVDTTIANVSQQLTEGHGPHP
jgi:alpha-1,4-digalacturonate transport system substrate-binding protein